MAQNTVKVSEDDLGKGVHGFVVQIIILAIFFVVIILFWMFSAPSWLILFLAAVAIAIFIMGIRKLKRIAEGKIKPSGKTPAKTPAPSKSS